MDREAIEKIAELVRAEATEVTIDGRNYTTRHLTLVTPPVDRPQETKISSLDGLVKMLRVEIVRATALPVFVSVVSEEVVVAYTTYNKDYTRCHLYRAVANIDNYDFGWREYEEAMIALRSRFEQDLEVEYILDLLKRISDEDSVATTDNGLSQTVEVKKGVALRAKEGVRPHVTLRPYRTFLEVAQPASTFLLRLKEGGKIGLFEADGGMWKLDAKRTIASYLESALEDLVGGGDVIVTI